MSHHGRKQMHRRIRESFLEKEMSNQNLSGQKELNDQRQAGVSRQRQNRGDFWRQRTPRSSLGNKYFSIMEGRGTQQQGEATENQIIKAIYAIIISDVLFRRLWCVNTEL